MDCDARRYRDLYERVGADIGWDFGDVKVTTEGVKWRFYEEVRQSCKERDFLLDIGTGGGKRVLALADSVQLIVGIDLSKSMIQRARNNLRQRQAWNARFLVMDAHEIDFPPDFFNIIACRHSPFNAEEVARLLPPGGLFITQQVSEGDKLNIKRFFKRGQGFGTEPGTAKESYVSSLEKAGFSELRTHDYNATEYYETPEDLLFLLRRTPILPDFGTDQADFQMFQRFVAEHTTQKGIITNSQRYMIVARK
jgi:SAM-dependent methyltransferase